MAVLPSQKKKQRRQQVNLRKPICLHGFGFGAMGNWLEGHTGEPSMIPVVMETSLTHDNSGLSYRIGTNIVMESMFWNEVVPVTIKRLRRVSASSECYSVDELINENNYMLHVRHPNILLLLAICPVDRFENIILIYERISLGSLHALVHHKGVKFSKKSTCTIMMQVCNAVSYLHYKDLIHSYITPSAIQVMSSYDCVKLGNFEFMVDGTSEGSVPVTRSFPLSETNWLAPEIFTEKAVSKKSDVYGIGVVLWEILHDKKPFGGLLTSEIEFVVMESQDRALPIDPRIEMPFSALLDLALKCDPGKRSCSIKNIHDAMTQTVMSLVPDEPNETRRKQTTPDKRCSLSCLHVTDQTGNLDELQSFQDADDAKLMEQHEWHSRKKKPLAEQEEPSGPDGEGVTIDEVPVMVTGGARLHKVKAVSKLVKENKDYESKVEDGPTTTENIVPDVTLAVSDDDLPSVATEADPFELDQGWPMNKQGDDESLSFENMAKLFSSSTPDNPVGRLRVAVGSDGTKEVQANGRNDPIANNTSFVTVFDTTKSITDVVGDVIKSSDREKGTEVLLDADSRVDFSSGRSQLSFEKLLDGTFAPFNLQSLTQTKLRSELDNEFNIKAAASNNYDVISTDQQPSAPAKELSYTKWENLDKSCRASETAASNINKILNPPKESSNNISGDLMPVIESGSPEESYGSQANRTNLSSVVQLRHSIESMKRAFFFSDSPTSASHLVPHNSSADMKAGAQRNEIFSSLKTANASSFVQKEPSLNSLEDLASKLTSSDSVELLKAFANKPLPPLPRTYIKPTKTEKQMSVFEPGKEEILRSDFVNQLESDGGLEWMRSPLQKSYVKETRVYSYSSKPNRVFGLGFPMTASNTVTNRSSEGQGTGLSSWGTDSKTPQYESFQRSGFNGGLVLHRPPDADISALYELPAYHFSGGGGGRSLATNLDFMTGFKPASHHMPSMVAPHLTKRTPDRIVTGVAVISPRVPARPSWHHVDAMGFGGYRLVREQEVKEQEQDYRLKMEQSAVKISRGENLRKETAKDLGQNGIDDIGSTQDAVETSDMASSMATASQPSPGIRGVPVIKSSVVGGEEYSSGGRQMAARDHRQELGVGHEELVGDNQIVTSKEGRSSGANLEVQDTQRRELHRPVTGANAASKLPIMKVGTSLTIPPSDHVSQLIGDADLMHRFKSDPLLQRDDLMKKRNEMYKRANADKTSDESQLINKQVRSASGETRTEDDDAIIIAESEENDSKMYTSNIHLQLEMISDDQKDNLAESGICEVSCIVKSAIADALNKIMHEHLGSQCPCCSTSPPTIQ